MFILLLGILPVVSFAKEICGHDEGNFRCVRYIKNYDADTVMFDIPNIHPLLGRKLSIRVSGVDAPEIKTKNQCEKKKALNAKKLVSGLLRNAKRIDLENIKRGKYFRVVADVKFDGKSLSHYLLKNGFAYSYDGGAKRKINWCKSYREIASESRNRNR